MMDWTGKRARESFNSGWYCAESVLRALAEVGGRYEPGMERVASGFCSGMSRTNGLCWAVSGAIMGMGLYGGRTEPAPEQSMDVPYSLVQEFLKRFRTKFQSTNCRELTGCDFITPQGHRRFQEENIGRVCRDYCDFAASTALEVLADAGMGPMATVIEQTAPCGLNCGKCMAFKGSEIHRHAKALQEAMGPNFAQYADRFAGMNPVFEAYDEFASVLDFLAEGTCSGCRKGGEACLFTDCGIKDCVHEHGVQFCHECNRFPCEDHGLPEALEQRWRENNERMREKGLYAYALELRLSPRYP